MIPYPISLHRCPKFRDIVTRAPFSAQTGFLSVHLTRFLPSSLTCPTVAAALTLSINNSPSLMGSTTSLSFAPTTRSMRCVSSLNSYQISGALPAETTMLPTSLSLLTTLGSRVVMSATLPPGMTSLTSVPPVIMDVIFVRRGFQTFWFFSWTS